MVVFGGGEGWGAENCFNDLFVLDTRHGAAAPATPGGGGLAVARAPVWLRPSFSGTAPSPRTGHSAVVLGACGA